MIRVLVPLVLCAALAALTAPAKVRAAGDGPLTACLEETGLQEELRDYMACIGTLAQACNERQERETTISMIDCQLEETRRWDEHLNAWYRELQAGGNFGNALRDAQRAWIAYRDEKCGVWHEYFKGGSLAGVAASRCEMEEVGRRAIEVYLLRDR